MMVASNDQKRLASPLRSWPAELSPRRPIRWCFTWNTDLENGPLRSATASNRSRGGGPPAGGACFGGATFHVERNIAMGRLHSFHVERTGEPSGWGRSTWNEGLASPLESRSMHPSSTTRGCSQHTENEKGAKRHAPRPLSISARRKPAIRSRAPCSPTDRLARSRAPSDSVRSRSCLDRYRAP